MKNKIRGSTGILKIFVLLLLVAFALSGSGASIQQDMNSPGSMLSIDTFGESPTALGPADMSVPPNSMLLSAESIGELAITSDFGDVSTTGLAMVPLDASTSNLFASALTSSTNVMSDGSNVANLDVEGFTLVVLGIFTLGLGFAAIKLRRRFSRNLVLLICGLGITAFLLTGPFYDAAPVMSGIMSALVAVTVVFQIAPKRKRLRMAAMTLVLVSTVEFVPVVLTAIGTAVVIADYMDLWKMITNPADSAQRDWSSSQLDTRPGLSLSPR